MKNSKHLFLMQIVSLLLFCLPIQCLAIDLQLQPGVTFDLWQDNHNAHASQLTFPLLLTGTHENLSVRLTTAYTMTSLSTGSKDISMSGLLDTKVGATYRLSDKLPFELLIGLDFNLPTGQTKLTDDETQLIMDPDLLPINTYGEGFNVNPTVTIAKRWNNWLFALGVGYLWRGSYDFSETLTDFQPGMVFNTLAEARYYYSSKNYLRLFTGYTVYGTDTSEGRDTFKEGNVLQAGGSFFHSVSPKLNLMGGIRGTFRENATVFDKTLGTKQNLNAFNGTEAVLDLGGNYAFDSKTVLSVPLQFRLIADNGNSPPFHAGDRQKYSLGTGVTRTITPMLSADLSLKGFYKHDAATTIPEPVDARSFFGFGIAASLTGRF